MYKVRGKFTMTKDQLIGKFIELNQNTNVYMERVSNVLVQLNDNNKLHRTAIEANTTATKEMTRSFNKIWYIFWAVIVALIVLAGAEKALKFL